MSKTPEEKARKYAKQEAFNNSYDDESYRHIYDIVERAYISGYHSRDEEVKAYREALKEMVDASINTCDMQSYIKGEEIPEDAWDKNVDYLREKADKAKQLLGENKRQTCYKTGKPCDCSGLCRESY